MLTNPFSFQHFSAIALHFKFQYYITISVSFVEIAESFCFECAKLLVVLFFLEQL